MKIPGWQLRSEAGYLIPQRYPVVHLYLLLHLQVSSLQEMPYSQILQSLLPELY